MPQSEARVTIVAPLHHRCMKTMCNKDELCTVVQSRGKLYRLNLIRKVCRSVHLLTTMRAVTCRNIGDTSLNAKA